MNSSTKMKHYQQRLMKAILHIQHHLDEDLRLEDLARVSCFSVFHFQRIFHAFTGESLQAHIKRLRLERAASDLIYTQKAITDIALEASFATPSSFAKAFKGLYGISPRALRSKGALTDVANPFISDFKTHEEVIMKYTIVDMPAQEMVFVRKVGSYFDTAPEAWRLMVDYADRHDVSLKSHQLIAIAYDDPAVTDESHCRFDAGITGINQPTLEDDLMIQRIIGGRFAVFEHHGAYDKMGDTYRQIYGAWLPGNAYELRDAPTFCHYVEEGVRLHQEMSDADKAKLVTKIYLPIQ